MELLVALDWKNRIMKLAEVAGFVAVGFTSAEPIEGLKEFLEERHALGWQSSFEEKEILKRVDPKAVWTLCETVVALAFPLPFSIQSQVDEGILARSAVGEDYHSSVKKALAKLINAIEEAGWPGERPLAQVDTGSLNERAFATRAGLGWIGKNQQLIIPEIGSFVALALVLLDQALPPDTPLTNQCEECTLCIRACPAKVLGPRYFQANQCLSYLTQSKELLSEPQQIFLGKRIFGCDTCQEVCPHNRAWLSKEAELETHEEGLKSRRGIDLWDTLSLTKGEFNKQWKSSAAGWRGKGILQRNAYLALKNINDPRLKSWEDAQSREEVPALIKHYIIKKD